MSTPFQGEGGSVQALKARVTPFVLPAMPPVPAMMGSSRPEGEPARAAFQAGLDSWRQQVSKEITDTFAAAQSVSTLQAQITALTARVVALETKVK